MTSSHCLGSKMRTQDRRAGKGNLPGGRARFRTRSHCLGPQMKNQDQRGQPPGGRGKAEDGEPLPGAEKTEGALAIVNS